MIRRQALRALFEARISEAMQHGTDMAGYRRGCLAFAREFHETMGTVLREERGAIQADVHVNDRGLPYKPRNSAHANEVSLRDLAEAIMGHDFVNQYYDPRNNFDFSNRSLMEAAVDPTAFVNINTFNISISGLVNAEIMERFDAPEYIGRNLVSILTTKMNGHKRIGVAKLAAVDPLQTTSASKGRFPGEPHAEVGFSEMYQFAPETTEQALKIPVTREAVFFDLTGQVIQQAGEVGDELAYGQEKTIADTVLGVQTLPSRYNFNGTTYETYQPTSPFSNSLSNPFADITDVDDARQKFVGMTDPVTGREIQVNSYEILCLPAKELLMRNQIFGANVQIGTQQSAGNFPTFYTSTGNNLNSVGRGTYTLIPLTAIWFNRLTNPTTLALSATIANQYWWIGDFKRAFEWQENWPLTPWQAAADELTMKDRGLIAIYGANYRGSMFVKEPRYVVRSTN